MIKYNNNIDLKIVVYYVYFYESIKFYIQFLKIIAKRRELWHATCFQNICQHDDFIQNFIDIIPNEINPDHKQSPKDFTRNRDLPFPKLIAFTLSIAASGTKQGVDTKSGQFFKNAKRSGLWPYANAVHRSSVTKARQKVPYQVFSDILKDAVNVAYDLWPKDDPRYLWHGMSVYATDGSKYNLPATKEIRNYFDPESGLQNKGKGHYPQCLTSTLYDVFRRLPVARTVVGIDGSEREEMKNLLPFVHPNSVWMFDRGYPSYESILYLKKHFSGYYLFRCPASCTFPAVEAFINSGKKESIIWITPSNKFKSKVGIKERKKLKPIKIRVIRLASPDGTISVLLTNLFNKKKCNCEEVIKLYFKRWRVEEYYKDEKVTLEIERFHSRTVNGILQEFYAAMIMSVISRSLMVLSSHFFLSEEQESQFKNAVIALSADAAFLVPDNPEKAAEIFKDILVEIARVKYYRPKEPRSSQPRVNKSPLNKWQQNKTKKVAANA